MSGILVGFIVYLAAMLGIGLWASRKQKNEGIENFILGGRNYGPILTAFGFGTSMASGQMFIGLVGTAYMVGTMTLIQPLAAAGIELILWVVMAKRVRRFSQKTGSITSLEVVSNLRGDPYNLIKIVGGLLITLFSMYYLGSQFGSGAKAATALNIPFKPAAIVCAVAVIAYTFFGGTLAVMLTDAVQGVMMILSTLLLVGTSIAHCGGFSNLISTLASVGPAFISWTNGKAGMALAIGIIYWFAICFGFLGQPQGIQKFIIMKDEKAAPKAAIYSVLFNILRQYLPIIIGLCGRVLFPVITDPETITPTLISTYFPGFFGGMMLAAIFAAIMSTTDSLLLQSTSEFTRNVLQKGLWKNITDKQAGIVAKVVTLIIGALGLFVAFGNTDTMYNLVNYAFAGLGATLAMPLFFGFLWKKCTGWGVLAGVVTGVPFTILWKKLLSAPTGIHEGLGANILVLIVIVVVSLLTQSSKYKGDYALKDE